MIKKAIETLLEPIHQEVLAEIKQENETAKVTTKMNTEFKYRELMFRAWSTKKNEFLATGFHIIGETVLFDLLNQHRIEELDTLHIQQSTGMVDKNGVDIYEGDIVKLSGRSTGITGGEVMFKEYPDGEGYSTYNHLGWCVEYLDETPFLNCKEARYHSLGDYDKTEIEIVGNIFEGVKENRLSEFGIFAVHGILPKDSNVTEETLLNSPEMYDVVKAVQPAMIADRKVVVQLGEEG